MRRLKTILPLVLAVICLVSTALPVHAAKIESINAKDYGPLMGYVNGVTLGTPTGGAIKTYAHYDTNTNNAVYLILFLY